MKIDYLGMLAAASRLDRRIIYLLVAASVALPLLAASTTRLVASGESEGFHRAVQQLHEGDVVLLATEYNAGTAFELEPMLVTLVEEVFARGARIVALCFDAQGVGLVDERIGELAAAHGKSYGTDWVFLGYRPSAPGVIISLATAPYTVFPTDHRGNSLIDLPVSSTLAGYADYRLVVVLASGTTAQDWVIYGKGRFQAPIIAGLGGGIGPTFQSFIDARAITGLIAGLRGAAEYEQLAGRPGEALRALSAQSVGHLLLIALILLGNASFFAARWLERTPR